MSDPETCLGCARKVPDESGWKEQHAEHCSPDPSAIAARARAEAFEECARIAEEWGSKPSPWGYSEARDGEANAVAEIAAEIRRRAKT